MSPVSYSVLVLVLDNVSDITSHIQVLFDYENEDEFDEIYDVMVFCHSNSLIPRIIAILYLPPAENLIRLMAENS